MYCGASVSVWVIYYMLPLWPVKILYRPWWVAVQWLCPLTAAALRPSGSSAVQSASLQQESETTGPGHKTHISKCDSRLVFNWFVSFHQFTVCTSIIIHTDNRADIITKQISFPLWELSQAHNFVTELKNLSLYFWSLYFNATEQISASGEWELTWHCTWQDTCKAGRKVTVKGAVSTAASRVSGPLARSATCLQASEICPQTFKTLKLKLDVTQRKKIVLCIIYSTISH